MVSNEEIDKLAIEVEQRIEETNRFLSGLPDFPPREGKYATRGGFIPVDELETHV